MRNQEGIPCSVNGFGAIGRSRATRDHSNYPLSERGGPSHTSVSSMKVTVKRMMSPPTDRDIANPSVNRCHATELVRTLWPAKRPRIIAEARMAITNVNNQGLLPSHNGNPADMPGSSPYRATTVELGNKFGTTAERRAILKGFLQPCDLTCASLRCWKDSSGSTEQDIGKRKMVK